MNTLKTMGKRMKPIFVFVLLEALLAGFLIGCQTQGLDLDGDLRLILSYCFILFVALFQCLDRSGMETDPKKWRRGILAFIAVLVDAADGQRRNHRSASDLPVTGRFFNQINFILLPVMI